VNRENAVVVALSADRMKKEEGITHGQGSPSDA